MTNEYDIIIVGGGASGLTSAIVCARKNKKVLVLEKTNKPGKKIYATGNGKCNYTNEFYDKNSYRGTDTSIVDKVFEKVDYLKVIEFFKELGVFPRNKNGYYYPYSEQASSVVEVMLMEINKLGVNILCDNKVESIFKEDKFFKVKVDNNIYKSKKVIISAGGMASPKLESDGSGYKLAKGLGHSIVKPFPALVQLKGTGIKFKEISGVRCQAKVSLYDNKKIVICEKGEIVFTDYGISGIPILQISRFASELLEKSKKISIEADLIPDIAFNDLVDLLEIRKKANNHKNNYEILVGLLNNKLADFISKRCNNGDYMKMAELIKCFRFDIVGTNGFDNAQVTAGGINVKDINFDTLESKCCKGLYFTGEILDIDGNCGGYNLQWAWSTGMVAGENASKTQ